jgi:hypothetical protein
MVFPGFALMLTLAAGLAVTVITIAFEVAGLFVAQNAVEIISQVTVSPFARELLEKTALLEPALIPPTFH